MITVEQTSLYDTSASSKKVAAARIPRTGGGPRRPPGILTPKDSVKRWLDFKDDGKFI